MIHYHGLPITPVTAMLHAMRGRHAMVSFEHPAQIEEAAEVCQSVSLDNGAFSAWRHKRSYDFDGYVEWATKWLKHPAVDWAIVPDVIDGDYEANERLLGQWPLGKQRGVPVWHLHEPLERIQWLIRSGWTRIALGSSGEWPTPGVGKWWDRMAQVMRVACDEEGMPLVKLHGLRMLDPVIFAHLPLSSADSCNVARNIGIDSAWDGPYSPRSKTTRALVMMERIEHHASARRWCNRSSGVQQNMELIG